MNEKMKVLELLENGKITAEEAGNLIESLGRTRPVVSKETRENVEEKVHQFAEDVNRFAKDMGCKIKDAYKVAEPRLKKASQSALEKAAAALDTLACNISESLEKAKEEGCCGEDSCCCGSEDDNAPVPN